MDTLEKVIASLRATRLLIIDGRKVSAQSGETFEVEDVVIRHPLVKDVAAFGIESSELESESELMIAVVLEDGAALTAPELARFINTEAPYYFVPRFIDFAAKLPRNDHGRLVKQDLRDVGVTPTTWDREQTDFVISRD